MAVILPAPLDSLNNSDYHRNLLFPTNNDFNDHCFFVYVEASQRNIENFDGRFDDLASQLHRAANTKHVVDIDQFQAHPQLAHTITKNGFASWQQAYDFFTKYLQKRLENMFLTVISGGKSITSKCFTRGPIAIWSIRLVIWEMGPTWSFKLVKGWRIVQHDHAAGGNFNVMTSGIDWAENSSHSRTN